MALKIKPTDVVKGIFSSYAPVTTSTFSSAKEAASDVTRVSKQLSKNLHSAKNQVDKSNPGRRAITLFNSAKDSLRDGNYELSQANDDMYDDYESYENNFSSASLTEEERANMAPEDVILRGNKGIAQSVIKASSTQLRGMDIISNRTLKGTLKGMEASTKSINATILYSANLVSTQIGITNNKLDAINDNLVNLINYQNQNTTVFYEKTLETMNSMIAGMNNLNSASQGKRARNLKNFDVRSGFNFKEYASRVKKGIKGSTLFSGAGMLGSMYQMANDNPDIMNLGEMIGSFIPTIASLVPGLSKVDSKVRKVSSIDNRLRQYMEEILYKINDKLESNTIASVLGLDSLGNKRRRVGGINTGAYIKEQMPWNGKAQKALTEVIPELLTSIDAGINKVDKRYFDYDAGTWKDRKEIEKDFAEQVNNSIVLEFSKMMDDLSRKFEMSGKSKSEIDANKKKLSNVVTDRIFDAGDLQTARQEMADIFESMNLSIDEFNSMMNTAESSINRTKESLADFYANIGSTDSVFRNINNRSGSNASQGIGKRAFDTVRTNRNSINTFESSFSKDVDATIKYIETMMKDENPDFKITQDLKEGILLSIRQGMSDTEILRQVKNTVGKQTLMSKAGEFAGRTWAKIRGKEYVKKPVIEDNSESYGESIDKLNHEMIKKLYGVHTSYGNKPSAGAASSARTKMDGKSAGAGTKGSPNSGKTSVPEISGRDIDKVKSAVFDNATIPADEILTSGSTLLDNSDKDVAKAADAIVDIGKDGSTSIGGSIKNLIDASVTSIGAMISSFSTFTGRLFGKEGLISNFFESDTFKNAIDKVKKKIFYDQDGKLRTWAQKAKDFGIKAWDGTKEKLNSAYDYAYDAYSKSKYGEEYQNNESWKNSSIMQMMNFKSKRNKKRDNLASKLELTPLDETNGVYQDKNGNIVNYVNGKFRDSEGNIIGSTRSKDATVSEKSSAPEIEKADTVIKESVQKVSKDTPAVLKESVEKISAAGNKSAEMIEDATKATTTALVGNPDESPEDIKKKYSKPFNDIAKKHLSKIGAGAILGAGVGMLNGFGGHSLLGSLFLPTGLLGGAIVGGGLTLITQTEAFKSLMFGKKGEDGKRSGGLISKELSAKFKKVLPIAVGGAVAGGLKSLITAPLTGGIASGNGLGVLGMQLLPGGILGGAILGMGIGLLKNSEGFKNLLFGKKDEDGKRSGTWLSKSFKSMKEKIAGKNEVLKKMLKGGALGVVSGAVLSHMGAIPAALSIGGPIGMGIMGLGLGIASSTDKFNNWLFGTEEFDNNGKSLGRKGGVLGQVKNLININVVEPIGAAFKRTMLDMVDWAKEKITLPFRSAFGPILDSIRGIKDNVVDFVTDKFKVIGEGITSMIKKTLSALFSPITKLIGGIGKALLGGAKVTAKVAALPLTTGLSAMNLLTSGKRRKEYGKFYKSYYTGGMMDTLKGYWDAKQQDYDEEAAEYNAEADKTGKKHKKAKKVGFFDKASDFLSAITGNGMIADAARSGWNETAGELNQNSMNWRNVFREKKELRTNRNERHKAERQWEKIRKLSQKIGNKDLHGREVTLNDKMFEKYKEKFVKAGVDASLINTNDDLMKLIYDPRAFRKQAAGDTGRDGMLQALKAFRLTPEEIAERERTAQFQDNVTSYLSDIKDAFSELSEEEFFNRSKTSYEEDRRSDMKRLKRRYKSAGKSSLFDDRAKIDFKDPELNEYDIRGISKDDLNDYALSEYAKNNDFKGWLTSIGRKMSPDDYRRKYMDPDYLKNTRNGKSSTDNITNKDTPESTSNEPFASERIVTALEEQTNIAKAEAELNAGGSRNFKNLFNKSKRGVLNAKTAAKNGISGFFGNLFKRKKKDDADAADAAKEAAESEHAQALGDKKSEGKETGATITETKEETKKKTGILSKIFGGLSWFGGTKVGKFITGGIKLFGAVGLLGGIGLTIAELIKPGTATSIGDKISNWNTEMQEAAKEGTLFDKLTGMVTGWFGKLGTWVNEKLLSEDGYLVKGANKVAEYMPKVLDNFILPGIERTAEFVTNNAATLVNAASTVVTAIAPPLAEALVNTVPDVIASIADALWDRIVHGKTTTKGKDKLTDDEASTAKSEGKYVGTNYQSVTKEEAEEYEAAGYTVRKNSDGTYELENNYTLDSNVYLDKNGNEQKVGNSSQLTRLGQIGTQIIGKTATGNFGGAAHLAGTALKAGMGTLGGTLGLTLSPITGVGGVIGGAKAGNKLGKWTRSGVTKLGDLISGGGKKAAGEAAEVATEKGASWFSNLFKKGGKAAGEAATEAATNKSGSVFSKITGLFKKGGTKAAGEAAEDIVTETAETLAKAAANTAGTGIEAVADAALTENKGFLQKCIDAIKKLGSDKAVNKAVTEGAGEVTEAVAKKGISKVIEQVTEWLGKAMLEIAQKSKLGEKIIQLIAGKSAVVGAKSAAAVGTAGLFEIGSIAVGAAFGALDTGKIANLFEVSKSMVNGKMRLVSTILNAFFSSTVGAYVDIALMICELIAGFDVTKWMAAKMYNIFASEAGEEYMDKAKDALAVETALYNQKAGTNMTTEEYNEAANKGVFRNLWGKITGKNIDNKGLANEAEAIINSGNYTIDKDGNAIINSSTSSNVGNGTGAVGYGPGQSQSNSSWANMPIGRFANGKISTMKTGGCGPTALSTIANMYGPGINPGTVGAYAAANGFISDGGANADLFTKGAAGLGLHATTVNKNKITDALSSGHPMAISGKNSGPFTKNGHVVVANGISNGKISIIDPMDGKTKVYSENQIKSGMTNAWAYQKPIGYGSITKVASIVKDKVLNGLSDNTRNAMVTNLGIVQTALSSIPTILSSALESIAKIIPSTVVTPITTPLTYAVNAIGTLGKILNQEELTGSEASSITATSSSTINKISDSIRSSMRSVNLKTKNITSSTLKNSTKSITGKTGILSSKKYKYSTTNKEKKSNSLSGYGRGPVGFDGTTTDNEINYYDDLQKTMNSDPTSIGEVASGLTKFGAMMNALWDTILGNGSFTELYEANISGKINSSSGNTTMGNDTIGSNNLNSSLTDVEASTMNRTTENQYIWDWLRSHGFNAYGAAGVMGCFEHESRNTAKTIEGYYLKRFPGYNNVLASSNNLDNYTTGVLFPAYAASNISINKSGYLGNDNHYYPGFGYAQWTGPRGYNLLEYSKQNGYDWSTPEAQLSFLSHELSTSYTNTASNTKNASSIESATSAFFDGFEMGKNATTKYPSKYQARLASAKGYYELYKNRTAEEKKYTFKDKQASEMAFGPVGFGPDDDTPTTWSQFMSGFNSAKDYLNEKIKATGLFEYLGLSDSNSSTGEHTPVVYDPSEWGYGGTAPVEAMKSILGQIKYGLGSTQDPDKGTASCASTVAWAYKKATGYRPGDDVHSTAYMGSTSQAKDPNFTTIWENTGSGLTDDVINNVLRPGDILYQNWDRTSNNGEMKHTEMYAGNGQDISHGGPGNGPVFKDLNDNRKRHTMLIRRYNGYLKSNASNASDITKYEFKDRQASERAFGKGPIGFGSDDITASVGNEFEKEIKKRLRDNKNPHPIRPNPNGEGDHTAVNNNTDIVDRLDKIVTIVGEWYLANKKKDQESSTNNTTTVVNNTNVQATSQPKESKPVTTHIDKLAQKHQTYSKMYRTNA